MAQKKAAKLKVPDASRTLVLSVRMTAELMERLNVYVARAKARESTSKQSVVAAAVEEYLARRGA